MRSGLLLQSLLMKTRMFALVLAALSPSSAVAEPVLSELLARTAVSEKFRNDTTCSFLQTSRVEQLDDDGAVVGTLYRTTAITQRGLDQLSLKDLSERVEGEISSRLRDRPAPRVSAAIGSALFIPRRWTSIASSCSRARLTRCG